MLDLTAFDLQSSRDLVGDSAHIFGEPGAYAVLLRPSATIPEIARAPVSRCREIGTAEVLYVGATGDCVGTRLRQHVDKDSRVSSFRRSLGLVVGRRLGLCVIPLPPSRQFCFTEEHVLSDWLKANTVLAVQVCDRPFAVEADLLSQGGGALNLAGVPETGLRRGVRELHRRVYRAGRLGTPQILSLDAIAGAAC